MTLGYSIAFEDGECKIKDKHADTLLACVRMTATRLFPLDTGDVGSAQVILGEIEEAKL